MRIILEITEGESTTKLEASSSVAIDRSSSAIPSPEVLAQASVSNAMNAGSAPVKAIA